MEYVRVFFDGTPYNVPSDLTIMTAMEYAGFRLVRGCGCRHGFCGACGVIYRVAGQNALGFVLACQTQVEDGMYVATMPFFPLNRREYCIETLKPDNDVIMKLFPEIFGCVACNSCTKSCAKGINTMQYIAYAKRNDLAKCANESFDCVGCNICAARCPAGISQPLIGLLARRLTGKYIIPKAEHTQQRVDEINSGMYDEDMKKIMNTPMEEIKEMYNARVIEK